MLDIKFIRENKEKVKRAARNKNVKVDVDKLLKLDEEKRDLMMRVEKLREERNIITEKLKNKETLQLRSGQAKEQKEKIIAKAKTIKKMLSDFEPQLTETSEELLEIMYHVPNMPTPDVHIGKSDKENKIIKKWGEPAKFNFKPKSHAELGEKLDLIDAKRGAKISGSRFVYLKGKAVLLEFAMVQWLMDLLVKEGFEPINPPVLEKIEVAKGTGYFESLNDDAYHTSKDELILVGTSEQSILPYYMDEIIPAPLPKRLAGFSTCFRREAGSYGKDVMGAFRVHQFDKVEMVSFCEPEKSEAEHKFLLSIEEKIMQKLMLPYQVSQMCTGDLGMPAANKLDLEIWTPSQKKYRELTSTSNCTDFQARRLNIKYKNKDGKNEFVHILNGTGLAIHRTICLILENYQTKNGSVKVPEVLQKYCGFKEIK